MKQVLIIMDDDEGGPRVMRYDCPEGVKEEDTVGTKEHTRGMISQLIAMGGVGVIEATNLHQAIRVLDTKGEKIAVAIVVEQEAGSKNCLLYMETVRAKYGERIKIIGVAETIECMEQMASLRVSKLVGAPLGYIDLEGVLQAVREYAQE